MTTFQDPPLQSRRAVRQNERESAPAAVVPTTGPTATPVAPAAPAEPLTYTTQGRVPVPNYDGPGLRTRRSAPAPARASTGRTSTARASTDRAAMPRVATAKPAIPKGPTRPIPGSRPERPSRPAARTPRCRRTPGPAGRPSLRWRRPATSRSFPPNWPRWPASLVWKPWPAFWRWRASKPRIWPSPPKIPESSACGGADQLFGSRETAFPPWRSS